MAYDSSKPFSYGIPDGTYKGRATTASCFEKDGRLILDVNFVVINPQTGEPYKKDNGYDFEVKKRHWLTTADGAFNEITIKGIREWAKGWNPQTFDDFYWFQESSFANLAAIGEVELNFQIGRNGSQDLWVHDPNRPRGTRKAFVPDGAETDRAKIAAKWGAKAKAMFAAAPKAVAAPQAPARATTSVRPKAAPAPVSAPTAAWANYPQTADGAFTYYCSKLGKKYESAKHDDKWFEIFDANSGGKDPDQIRREDAQRLFAAIDEAFA